MYKYKYKIKLLENEKWYGGMVNDGLNMPYGKENIKPIDLNLVNFGNQTTSFFVSTKGRYFYNNNPIKYEIKNKNLIVYSYNQLKLYSTNKNLKEAYLAGAKHFKIDHKLPNLEMFEYPQYNTWMEIQYDESQEKVLDYANKIIENGYKPGVIMIDDNWQEDYGVWDFKASKFKNPKEMVEKLHSMGFKVMLWLCPFVSADNETFRYLKANNCLIKDKNNNVAIIEWWDGYSVCIDLTSPQGYNWLKNQCLGLMKKYNVDGFKFDAADVGFYLNIKQFKGIFNIEQARKYALLASEFSFNELRACFNMQGSATIQRLSDKRHSWGNDGIKALIPCGITASMLGYRYVCPDMIGGGLINEFLFDKNYKVDEELFVRYAQIATFFPMMQFSLSPFRVLSKSNQKLIKDCLKIHEKITPYIKELVYQSNKDGSPLIRPIIYNYPEYEVEDDELFMLGDKYLVLGVSNKNELEHEILLPEGKWLGSDSKIYDGNKKIVVSCPLDKIIYFEQIE